MDNIKTYLNQIIDNQTPLASETLEKILKERVKQRFSDAKDSVKKKSLNPT
jgi:hypothetical protein